MNSSRLIFKEIEEGDFERFFEIHSDPILSTKGYHPINNGIAQKVFQNLLDHWKMNNFGTWKLTLKSNPDYIIGFGGIYYRELEIFGRAINLGLAFDKQYWGLGLAFETAIKSIEFGFGKSEVEKIYAFTNRKNTSAIKVIKRCNMNFETFHNEEAIYSIEKYYNNIGFVPCGIEVALEKFPLQERHHQLYLLGNTPKWFLKATVKC